MTEIKPCINKWKGTMTDRQRFYNQMHYKSVDRCFNMEFGYWNENFSQWPLFSENGITNNSEADVFFNFDRIDVFGGQIWFYPGFEEKVIEETVDKKIIINTDGLLAEVPKDAHDTIPHFIKSSVVTPEDWKKVKEERITTVSICKKGRRNQQEYDRESSEAFKDGQRFRAGCEGSISVLKRAFNLGKCLFKGFKNYAASVGCAVFCHNLVLLTRL